MQPRVVCEAESEQQTSTNHHHHQPLKTIRTDEGSSTDLLAGMSLNAPDVGIVPQRSLLERSLQQAGRKEERCHRPDHGRNLSRERRRKHREQIRLLRALTGVSVTGCSRAPRVWVPRCGCRAGPGRPGSPGHRAPTGSAPRCCSRRFP
jgi:hypothetical protein